jgi:hypothetical protein
MSERAKRHKTNDEAKLEALFKKDMFLSSESYSETSIDADTDMDDFIVGQFADYEDELPAKKVIPKKDENQLTLDEF